MKSAPASAKGFLIRLAAEGIAPLVAGCAGALVAGPAGGVAGAVAGKVCEEAVKYFGPAIVESWMGWFRRQPPALQAAAVEAAANLSPSEARELAEDELRKAAIEVTPEDMKIALEYVAAIPSAIRRSLVADKTRGGLSVPATMALTNPRQLLGLLPHSLPPYQPGSDLPGTPYRLGELLGAGGFGAVYKATTPTLQHLHFAIKFCLDPSLLDALKRERANLDRLQSTQAAQHAGAERIVRLYGYDFDHVTPYLVYEFVPGRDLAVHLSSRRESSSKGMPADEALGLIQQVAEALAFAHTRGLVHRDLKPANVLVFAPSPPGPLSHEGRGGERTGERGEAAAALLPPLPERTEKARSMTTEGGRGGEGVRIKLTDFGIGTVTAQAAQHSRIGSTTLEQLNAAEQATLFRGAGTALYMSPEQRRGEPADPRHDLYSLGVTWYQLLTGDVTRELHPGWADELLEEYAVPPEHVEALRACVGIMKKRPEDGSKLLELLRHRTAPAPLAIPVALSAPVPRPILDAQPERPTAPAEPQKLREAVAQAVVAARDAKETDWRFGLMLAGIITGSITAALTLLFLILTLSVPRNTAFRDAEIGVILMAAFGPIAIGFATVAVLMGRARLLRQRSTRQALADRIEQTQTALSLPAIPCDRDNLDPLCQAGWDLVREIEDRHDLRHARVEVRYTGRWSFDLPIKVYVDGCYVGEGGRRRGIGLTAQLCRGTHYLELREHLYSGPPRVWRWSFVVGREANCRVEIGPLTGAWLKAEVVGAH